MTEFDRIKNVADSICENEGSIDIDLIFKMLGVPKIIIINVIEQCGYMESNIEDTYIEKGVK